MPEPQVSTVDGSGLLTLDAVALPEIPAVYALYQYEQEAVAAWVFDLPGHGPLLVSTDNTHDQVHARDLAGVADRWADLFDGELVAVAALPH